MSKNSVIERWVPKNFPLYEIIKKLLNMSQENTSSHTTASHESLLDSTRGYDDIVKENNRLQEDVKQLREDKQVFQTLLIQSQKSFEEQQKSFEEQQKSFEEQLNDFKYVFNQQIQLLQNQSYEHQLDRRDDTIKDLRRDNERLQDRCDAYEENQERIDHLWDD
ncbi:38832_t:CDS:2 [Gigaspora margarita]|uniref:38832_t:CDS:1 n=1 Tax=Gigaspora margarita TaxID=4874 RepID=A0ABN7UW10_GIGMA|nr:38832_t:CDS:2 [Gigaspora margarita]